MFLLPGTSALVTGGAKRLGRETALVLARAGCSVVVHYRSSEAPAFQLVDEVRALGVNAWPVQAELSSPVETDRLFDDSEKLAGNIDFVVNSASIFPESTLGELDEASLIENLRINSLAPFALTARLHEHLEAGGRSGAVVNFLDTRMLDYDRKHVPYHLSKRTLFAITRMTSIDYAPRLRVNGVAPGLVLPPPGEDSSYLDKWAHTNPLKTHGNGEQVAAAVLFLLWSRFVTGQIIYVDGGRHVKGRFYGS